MKEKMITIYHLPDSKVKVWGKEGYEPAIRDKVEENLHRRDEYLRNGKESESEDCQNIIDTCQKELLRLGLLASII